jgi:hypothetical protein
VAKVRSQGMKKKFIAGESFQHLSTQKGMESEINTQWWCYIPSWHEHDKKSRE